MNKKAGEFSFVLLNFLMGGTFASGGEIFEADVMDLHCEEKKDKPQYRVSFEPKFMEIAGVRHGEKKYKQLKEALREGTEAWDSFVNATKDVLKIDDLKKVGDFIFQFKRTVLLLRKADTDLLKKIEEDNSFKIFIKVMSANKDAIRLLSRWFRDEHMRNDLAYLLENFNK